MSNQKFNLGACYSFVLKGKQEPVVGKFLGQQFDKDTSQTKDMSVYFELTDNTRVTLNELDLNHEPQKVDCP